MATEIKDLSVTATAPAADGRIPWQNLDGTVGSATPGQLAGAGAEVSWGQIGGDIGDQTDLDGALDDKADAGAVTTSGLTMATARLLGRTTAATGPVEEITVGSGLSLSGGALTATGGGGGGDGDVSGPDGGVVDAEIAVYDGTTGKIIKGSGGATVAALESATTTAAGTATWGGVGGTLSDQTDLQGALDAKANDAAVTAALADKADKGVVGASGITAAAQNRLVGRAGGGPGALQELGLAGGLAFDGSDVTGAGIRHAPSNKFARLFLTPDPGDIANGELYLHQDPANDEWASVQYVQLGPLDSDGFRPPVRDAVGELTGGFVTVSGYDNSNNPQWATWEISSVANVSGAIRVNVGTLAASGGSLGDLSERVTVAVLPVGGGGSDIEEAGSEGQVALFDDNGKLVGSPMVVVSGEGGDTLNLGSVASAIIQIGNGTTPQISLGPSGGGGSVTVHSNATFNGALLSPGTGTNSFKAGAEATASDNNSTAIGNGATAAGNNSTAIGTGAVASGANRTAIGSGVTATHAGAVCIGRDGANNVAGSTAVNDFVLGVAGHNYKLPGTVITDLRFRTTTGTKIGTATDQLIGFWNATPVDQPDAIADATDGTDVITQCNAILAALRETGLIATA